MDCCGEEHELITYKQARQRYGEVWVGEDGQVWNCDND